MAVSEKLRSLVAQMPDPAGNGMYIGEMDKGKIEELAAEIHAGGSKNVLGLIDMLAEPGTEEDVKPHYALHCVGNHTLVIGDEDARRRFCEVLASQLDSDRSVYIKGFLCQELQWAGRKESTVALGKLLTDAQLVEAAAMALTAIGDGAAEQFRAALPKAKGKCRLNVVQGLGSVGDRQSAGALRDALSDADREIRLAAGWGLARMGDAGSVDALLGAANAKPGWERVQATKHCLVLAENLLAAGDKEQSARIYAQLRQTRTDPSEKYIRDAAEKALAGQAVT